MSKAIFENLLNQYISGEISPEDRERLGEMIDHPGYEDVLEAFVREVMLSDDYTRFESPRIKSELFSYLERAIMAERTGRAENTTTGPARPPFRSFSLWRYAAAAVLIILLGAGGYLVREWHGKKGPVAVVEPVVRDIAPGHYGAILTIAGGRQIVLDSTRDGKISQQGGVLIVKKNDQIAYQGQPAGKEVTYNTMSTPRGRQYQLILADGSRVWLNAASSITYPTVFAGAERRVKITGEAYLDIARNPSKPFVISAGGTTVKVLGTQLNVNAYADEESLWVTLIEGSVKVSPPSGTGVKLKPGQQTRFEPGKGMNVVKGVDMDEVVAWKNGQISFNHADLPSLMRQISRWYDIDVRYSGAIPQKRFFGLLDRNVYLSTILEYLRKNGIKVKQEGREIIVLS